MNLFIIGDIHGCFRTFKNLLEHWDRENELLIQLGDLIDRGNYSPETVKLCRELKSRYANAIFLKGNHEQLAVQYNGNRKSKWYIHYGEKVLWQYHLEERNFDDDVKWFSTLPDYWENEAVFVSHAGVSESIHWNDEEHPDGLIWNRSPLKHIGKLQIIGHTPQKDSATYTNASHSWNIDTGAYLGRKLSGIKLKENGELVEILSEPTVKSDIV